MRHIFHLGMELLFVYYLVSSLVYLLLLIVSALARSKHMFRQASMQLASLRRSPFLARVSIVVPHGMKI